MSVVVTETYKCDDCGMEHTDDSEMVVLHNRKAGWTNHFCDWECFRMTIKSVVAGMGDET